MLSISDIDLQTRYQLAQRLARESGKLTLKYFQSETLDIIDKSDGSPVTAADQEAERFLRAEIGKQFPLDSIVGEEFGTTQGDSGYCWALDPIDGTKSFITGVPLYGTMIAVIDQRTPENPQAVIGAVDLPALNEGIFAATGAGAWYYRSNQSPRKASVSPTDRLSQAVVLTSSVEGFPKRSDGSSFERLSSHVRFARTWGDVYGYLLVATGRADVMIDPEINVWDAAAVKPIIEEAGGRFTDWKNQPTVFGRDAIGSNGKLHNQILELLNHR